MVRRFLVFFLLLTAVGFADIFNQPYITAGGVMNVANYLASGFPNAGIARGSMFVIYGSVLGPQTPAVAQTFADYAARELGGTRVRIGSGAYAESAPIYYASATSVVAIMPSDAPEGDATLTVTFGNLTSTAVAIHIVKSAFGMFSLNQAGLGQAIVQNVSSDSLTVNTLYKPATPGQTVILWGTGLGPVVGDETSGPLPGQLAYLDGNVVYVGGKQAVANYAGRSGCCIALDQINFVVPAGVSGCYVPIALQTGGVTSSVGTMAISSAGQPCDDSLSFRAADLAAAQQNGVLRIGRIELSRQTAVGSSTVTAALNANFYSYASADIPQALAPVNPPLGSCYTTETRLVADLSKLPHSTPINAGVSILLNMPVGPLTVPVASLGSFSGTPPAGDWPQGDYSLSLDAGGDVGAFTSAKFSPPPALTWTNASAFPSTIYTSQPMTLQWSGGDSNGYVSIVVASSDSNNSTSIHCNQATSAQSLTVPDLMLRTLVARGAGTISITSFSAPTAFSATGLDVGTIRMSSTVTAQTTFLSGASATSQANPSSIR